MVAPAAAPGGAATVTVGFSVSGCDAIVRERSAAPVLPAASRTVACTRMTSPGEATVGTASRRWYGGEVTSDGSPPFTTNDTPATEWSSLAVAVTNTCAPGSTEVGPLSVTYGGV